MGSVGMVVALAATAWIQWSGASRHLLPWAPILFIAAFAFSPMAAHSTGLPFTVFALAMLIPLFVVARYCVGTKGLGLEDIDV